MNAYFLRAERLLTWGLFVILAIVVLFFIFWTPFNFKKLLHPIPENAVLISVPHDLGRSLQSLSENDFFKTSDPSGRPVAACPIGKNSFLTRMIPKRAILAYIPELKTSGNPAVAITSWTGPWTPILRLALRLSPGKMLKSLGSCNGRTFWAYSQPILLSTEKNDEYHLSFAFDDGIIMACISEDPLGVAQMINVCDGKSASLASDRGYKMMEKSPDKDKFWLRVGAAQSRQKKNIFATCTIDKLTTNCLSGQFAIIPSFLQNDGFINNRRLQDIKKIFACSPAIVSALSSAQAAGICAQAMPGSWARKINSILTQQQDKDNVCALMIFTGDYGGRVGQGFFSLAVPTAVLAVSGIEPYRTRSALADVLKMVNRERHLSLTINPTNASVSPGQVFVIESKAGGPLDSLAPEDRPAFAFYNDWLLLASNSSALKKILMRLRAKTPAPVVRKNTWFEDVSGRKSSAFARIEPREGGRVLRFALSTSVFMLERGRQDKHGQANVKILKAARALLEKTDYLSDCFLWLEPGQDQSVMHFELDRK